MSIAAFPFVVAGWAKGDAVPVTTYDSNPRAFGIRVIFNYTDGTNSGSTKTAVDFNPDVDSSVSWQYAAAPVVAQKAYSSITVQLVYDYNANTVWFDGIQLYKEEFGNSYTYDSNGNVISVKDLQAQTTQYEYTNNNLTKEILPTGAELTYTYDSYHNVKTATTELGIVYSFAYDTYGNNTSVSIGTDGNTISSSATYTANGNYLASTTDALGNVTTYSYDGETGELDWVQYPEDTEATRTNYTYDDMYRLTSTTATTDSGCELFASYSYVNDLLSTIETASTTYAFSYGDFALRSDIRIGDHTLASYNYTTRNHYLSSLDYGNGDSVYYTYDSLGRVTREEFEDGDTVSYRYDNSGALATVTDSETGISKSYYYDFTDRLMKVVETGTGYSHSVGYAYDDINNLAALVETINGVEHTTGYAYDDDNRVTSVTNGSTTRSYTYDNFSRVSQRVTGNEDGTVLTDSFTFRAPSGSATSGQVESLHSAASGYDVTSTYTYDDNGNILSVSDGTNTTSYAYDTANQLIRENNQAAGKTWVWTYDDAGNILNRSEYAYTTGSLGEALDSVDYTYGDDDWGDLLTGYDGNPITSDAIGNMLSDGTWTYTWKHGRQLASMSDGSATWTFTYHSDGLRTGRTNGTATYNYVYNGGSLSQMTVGSDTLNFAYDASGAPMSVSYNGTNYYYATNLQGDVTAILNASGTAVVQYTYDAWGNPLTTSGSMANTLGTLNPLRYRSYVYDQESGLYYLQSRYYNPEVGRFINEDNYPTTGQGFIGNNMFAYCGNNPAIRVDSSGQFFNTICGAVVGAVISAVTRKDNETVGEAIVRGLVTGAVAGAGLDICVATGGAATGLLVAGALGATAAMADTAWESHNNGVKISGGDLILSGVVGGGLNVLFGAAGREVGNAVGQSLSSIGKAMWDNTIRSITNKSGKVIVKKVVIETAMNLASSTVQGGFGKIYTLVGSKMMEACK